MPFNQTLIDDVMTLCGNALGGLADARHELKAETKNRLETVLKRLDLVSRDEFETAFAMLARTRQAQEDISKRLAAIEAKLKLSSAPQRKKAMKANLPSVKKDNRRRIRR